MFFVAGIMLKRTARSALGSCACIVCVIAGLVFIKEVKEKKRRLFYLSVWLAASLFIPAGAHRTAEAVKTDELKTYLEKSTDAEVSGTITYISRGNDAFVLTLDSASAQIGQNSYIANKILVSIDYSYGFEPQCGMFITAKGRLYPMEPATNDGQFDADLYYRTRFIDARLYSSSVPQVHSINPGIRNTLYSIRTILTDNLYKVFDSTQAGVLVSMITGDRGMLDSEVKELYSDSGIAHILAISSLHITLLGMGLYRLLMKVIRRLRASIAITLLVMWGYALLTGMSSSVLRAVIMLTITLFGRALGRGSDRLNSLSLSALCILVYQPLYLYDSGFQLSYSAVLGILAANRLIERYEIKNGAVTALVMSLSAQLFTLPFILMTYCSFNPYTVLLNPVILPFMSVVLVCALLSAAVVVLPVTMYIPVFIGGPAHYVLKLYDVLCAAECRLPYARIITGTPDSLCVVVYYAVVGITLYLLLHHDKYRRVYLGKSFLLVFCAVIFLRQDISGINISFADVGQGDSILIEIADANEGGVKRILVDSGSTSVKNVGTYRVIPFLKSRGIKRLDSVVISHCDTDHISAILEMLSEGYPQICEIVLGCHTDRTEEVIAAAVERGVPIRFVGAGDRVNDYITVVAPEYDKNYDDKNAASVVLLVRYDDFTSVLAGDSDFDSEYTYMGRVREEINDRISILKVAHHGSKYSTSVVLLDTFSPVCAVISCAKYNIYHHPSPDTLERLIRAGSDIHTTPDEGQMTFIYSDGEMKIIRHHTFFESMI